MIHIQPPNTYNGNKKKLFIAGGISDCPNWQEELVDLLKHEDIAILNPRRDFFDTSYKDIMEEQIIWEYNQLNNADAVSFWFPKETLCPITLYELGKISMANKELFVGVHPKYLRKEDVEIQTKLIRPNTKIVYSVNDLADQIKYFVSSHKESY